MKWRQLALFLSVALGLAGCVGAPPSTQPSNDNSSSASSYKIPCPPFPTIEPPTIEPPTIEPPTIEPPIETPTIEPPTIEPPTIEPPILRWSTYPVTVHHSVSVPPVPLLVNIRYAQHPECGYDRIVFDILGSIPSYDVRYVDTVIADGSGAPVRVEGNSFLRIRLYPAQAHTEQGNPTVDRARLIYFPMLRSYTITGDFEGVVSIVLGLQGKVGFQAKELSGRVYVDVAHQR